MSHRVTEVLSEYEPKVEVYSIDEAFILIEGAGQINLNKYLYTLQSKILSQVGIPTSIGVGRTKTLAKIAVHQAKRRLSIPVCILDNHIDLQSALLSTPVEEVWGVGRKWSQRLRASQIHNAFDLSRANAEQIRKEYNVVLANTVRELKGIVSIKLEQEIAARKNIMSSKSFGSPVEDLRL